MISMPFFAIDIQQIKFIFLQFFNNGNLKVTCTKKWKSQMEEGMQQNGLVKDLKDKRND